MANINAKMVGDLKKQTGAGLMDCKKALVEADGDVEKAVKILREKGLAAAAKKADRIAADGLIDILKEGNVTAMVEVNTETDFVAKNETFKEFVKGLLRTVVAFRPASLEELNACKFDGTDFTVDVVEDYVVIEETISNNVTVDFEIIKAFDINLKNSDGVHIQPDGSVKVKLPNDWSKSGVYKVYRVNDDGTLTDMNAYRQGSHLVFDTDHFSVYVIVVEDEAPTEPEAPETPDEEVKSTLFTKLVDLIKSFIELVRKLFNF